MATTKSTKAKDYLFEWEGKDRNGKPVRGEIRAIGENQVASTLRRQGIVSKKIEKRRISGGKSIKIKDIAIFTRQLATMLRAGVPILQTFEIVARGSSNPNISRLLTSIRSDVETGTSLSAALRKHPQYFDTLYCNLVESGEAAGILDSLLERLATYMEKSVAMRGKLKSALMYPGIVMLVAIIAISVIMIFVVPTFKQVFNNFGADLPAVTNLVVSISDFFVHSWYILFGILGGGIFGFMYFFKRSAAMRAAIDRILLKVPVFGPLIEKSCVSRWTRTLATMFAAGVPLVDALDSVGGASGNSVYEVGTKKIKQEVATGTSLTAAMNNSQIFPAMVLQMSAIGEESGSLDHMLGKAAEFYEEEVDAMVAGLSSLIEPLIMVVLAVIVGFVVVAMYLPIFKLGDVV